MDTGWKESAFDTRSIFGSDFKDSAPQVRLKIGLVGNDAGHNFTFTSAQPIAYAEREKFKKDLTTIIGRNKANAEARAPFSIPPALPSPAPSTPAANGLTPRTAAAPSRPSTSRAPSVSSERRGTPSITGSEPAVDFRLRKKVLLNNPELGALHRDLVMTGQITETEFWDGREHLLLAQAAAEKQRKGKSGQLVDPRPETVDGGEIKIRITPQLVHDIFDEYPVVAKAYTENVPKQLSEEEFWKRYFQSKLFNAHRASIRSSAAQHVVKDDPIFDSYLEKDDDGIEPRRQREEQPELFLDLAATQEDHGELTVERDVTMQAGRQKAALPLIRKFNEHSERLLNSALGDLPAVKRRRLDHGEETYSDIDIDDLHDNETSDGIILEMQDRQRYFEGRMAGASTEAGVNGNNLDRRTIIDEARSSLADWEKNLGQLKIERKAGDSALLSMTQNVSARLEVKSRKNDIPDGIFRQMTTCQTAANEFLRQYWSVIYPPAVPAGAPATPAQRATKAAKMIGYLSKTQEKIDAIVQTAQQHGVDNVRVETAMKPVLDAVNHALAFQRKREAAAAAPRRGR